MSSYVGNYRFDNNIGHTRMTTSNKSIVNAQKTPLQIRSSASPFSLQKELSLYDKAQSSSPSLPLESVLTPPPLFKILQEASQRDYGSYKSKRPIRGIDPRTGTLLDLNSLHANTLPGHHLFVVSWPNLSRRIHVLVDSNKALIGEIIQCAYEAACKDPDVTVDSSSTPHSVEVRAAGSMRSLDALVSNLPPNAHLELIEVSAIQKDQNPTRKSASRGSSVASASIMDDVYVYDPTMAHRRSTSAQSVKSKPLFTIGKLAKLGYSTNPPAYELETWSQSKLSSVKDFSIKKSSVKDFSIKKEADNNDESSGWVIVTWPGYTNLTHMDLSTIIRIEGQEVFLYRDEEEDDNNDDIEITTPQPPIGQGLNKKFLVQISGVLKGMPSSLPRSSIEHMLKERLEQVLPFATFDSLESRENGILSFFVEHL
jgi:hypothetical protein